MQSYDAPPEPGAQTRKVATVMLAISLAIIPLNSLVYYAVLSAPRSSNGPYVAGFMLLALLQLVSGFAALVLGIATAVQRSRAGQSKNAGVVIALGGFFGAVGALVGGTLGFGLLALGSMGGAWGRPLRIRGRVMHPELTEGTDWTLGDTPDTTGLDDATRAALAALWLHDAQKEHASVPAFARVTWMLTAMGAPAELVDRTLVAAREEVEHTRRCFALAAGYGGRSHTVEPMPDLLLGGGLDVKGDAFVHLALESLKDGCLLEDYNADVAAECAVTCREPVTRAVLTQIAREERSHAELSWSILAWALARGGAPVRERCARELSTLGAIERPTAVSAEKQALVDRADPELLRAHGRLPDARWAALYVARLAATRARLAGMLGSPVEARPNASTPRRSPPVATVQA
jgi:hypothetical protein